MRPLLRLAALAILVLALVAWWRWPALDPDAPYAADLRRPLWSADGPAVLVDAAHWNGATARRGLVAFATLLAADGYEVLPPGNAARAEMLADARIAVIADPLGVPGVLRRIASPFGLQDLAVFDDDALIAQEVETLLQWVDNGGGLLLAVDDAPFARGSRALAARLGVGLRGRLVVDGGHSEPRTPWRLVFSRENGLLGRHPIVDGWPDMPAVNRVVTFGGQALEPGQGVTPLLVLGESAVGVAGVGASPESGEPARGLAQAVAIERGRGRVVVLGDTTILTAVTASDGRTLGLPWTPSDNARFVRHVMRWLAKRD